MNGLTVREVIERLQTFDPDTKVVIDSGGQAKTVQNFTESYVFHGTKNTLWLTCDPMIFNDYEKVVKIEL